MATPELRHMLRDDDLNHEEQKQVLELARHIQWFLE